MMNCDSCSMKRVTDEAAVRAGRPGSFAFEDVPDGDQTYKRMWIHLPSGFIGALNLKPAPAHVPVAWPWNSNERKPTIKHPIRLAGRWSGQIKAGRMVSDAPAEKATAASVTPVLPPPMSPVRAAVRKAARRRGSV